MGAKKFDDIAGELYALDPAEFIPVRAERIKEAKKSGDKDLAAEIGKLRKPTLVAWAVNLASRDLKTELTGLLQLGDALRDAQRHLSGPQLKQLTTQRQQVVGVLAKRIGELAADNGHVLNETAIREVSQSLHAALADPDIATKVRNGTLVAAASYSGFGPAGLASVKEPATEPPKSEDKAAAKAELEAARAELKKRRTESEEASSAAASARKRLEQIDDRISQLRDELDRAEHERQFARSAERSAEDARRTAERAVHEAELRVEDAEDAVSG